MKRFEVRLLCLIGGAILLFLGSGGMAEEVPTSDDVDINPVETKVRQCVERCDERLFEMVSECPIDEGAAGCNLSAQAVTYACRADCEDLRDDK